MEIFTKIILPIATFTLGVLFTFIFSRYARRQQIISQRAEEICKLAAEWYEQIHEMDVALEHNLGEFEKVRSYAVGSSV
jgi:hypothetical protein